MKKITLTIDGICIDISEVVNKQAINNNINNAGMQIPDNIYREIRRDQIRRDQIHRHFDPRCYVEDGIRKCTSYVCPFPLEVCKTMRHNTK